MLRRRVLLPALALLPLAGCGFKLRGAPDFAFQSLYCGSPDSSPLWTELKRQLRATGVVQVYTLAQDQAKAQVWLDLLAEQREKVVVGLNAAGQVRELQLRLRVKFRLRHPQGHELIPEVELQQQRDMSFSETLALAKDAEERLLYKDMQTDIVQQMMRRLAAPRHL